MQDSCMGEDRSRLDKLSLAEDCWSSGIHTSMSLCLVGTYRKTSADNPIKVCKFSNIQRIRSIRRILVGRTCGVSIRPTGSTILKGWIDDISVSSSRTALHAGLQRSAGLDGRDSQRQSTGDKWTGYERQGCDESFRHADCLWVENGPKRREEKSDWVL